MSAFANCGRAVAHVRGSYVPILLQKSFLGDERNFLGPLMHFVCGDVRDLIVPHKNDHGPAHRRYRALQRSTRIKSCFREIFGVARFPTFATLSTTSGHPNSCSAEGHCYSIVAWLGVSTRSRHVEAELTAHDQSLAMDGTEIIAV